MSELLSAEQKIIKQVASEIYGSFVLNGTEVVVAAFFIKEVVNNPEDTIQMPLAPKYINGIFNLRGDIVPIINLKYLFGLADQNYTESRKIAVIEYQNILIGLAFDSTGEVFKSAPEEKYDLSHVDPRLQKIIKGIIKQKDSARLLQIIDTTALAALCHFPQPALNDTVNVQPVLRKKQKLLSRHKYVFFTVNEIKMAFDIGSIQEIAVESEIKESAFASDLCLGMINLRGQNIPVLDFSKALGEKKLELTEQCRTIVIKSGEELLGLVVSSLESIGSYSPDQLLHIPVVSKDRVDLFKGCIEMQDGRNLFLLNHDQIFKNKEIMDVVRGHKEIYPSEKKIGLTKKTSEQDKQVFVSFKLDELFALPIKEIKEIINFSEEILEPVGMSSYVKGILSLRGELITIIDTRRLYAIKSNRPVDDSKAKILIFKRLGNHFGLVVDSVASILSLENSKKVILPEVFSAHFSDFMKHDITEVINLDVTSENPQAVAIMNIEAVFKRLHTSTAA